MLEKQSFAGNILEIIVMQTVRNKLRNCTEDQYKTHEKRLEIRIKRPVGITRKVFMKNERNVLHFHIQHDLNICTRFVGRV